MEAHCVSCEACTGFLNNYACSQSDAIITLVALSYPTPDMFLKFWFALRAF